MKNRASMRMLATLMATSAMGLALLVPAAYAADTNTTFSLNGGALSVTVPASTALSDAATGAASLSGSLGTVTVDDARGGTAGWTASVTSTSFTGQTQVSPTVIANTSVSYAPGLATSTSGVVVATPGLGGAMGTSQTAFSGAAVVGNNSVSWAPTITVTLPSDALADSYAGTITHSVL